MSEEIQEQVAPPAIEDFEPVRLDLVILGGVMKKFWLDRTGVIPTMAMHTGDFLAVLAALGVVIDSPEAMGLIGQWCNSVDMPRRDENGEPVFRPVHVFACCLAKGVSFADVQ